MERPVLYVPSGRFHPVAALTWTVPMAILALFLSIAYAYLIWWSPIVYFNVLAPLLFAFGAGALAMVAARRGHVRNRALVFAIGLVLGLVALYGAWEAWLYAFLSRFVGPEANAGAVGIPPVRDPFAIPTFLHNVLAPVGVWEVKGTLVKGLALEAIWGLEALVLVLGPAFAGVMLTREDVYDERTGEWLTRVEKREPLEPLADVATLRMKVEAGDLAALGALRRIGGDASHFLRLECLTNPGGTAFGIRLKDVTLTKTKDGTTTSEKTVIPTLLLDRAGFEAAHLAGSERWAPPGEGSAA